MVDEDRFTALGGEAEAITGRLAQAYRADWPLAEALTAAVNALRGPDRPLTPHELEVAVLDRGNGRRAFRRVLEAEVTELLAGERPKRRGAKEGADQPGPAAETAEPAGTDGGTGTGR